MCSDIVLSARQLGKAFMGLERPVQALAQAYHGRAPEGGQMILRDISFDLHQGEAIGIIGRNGAGKSTLLKIISGVMRPSTGQVERRGRLAAMLELGAAFNPDFTGLENVRLVARVLGLSAAEVEAIIDPVRDFADIGPFFERRVAEYSSGMFARLAFAVNLHSAPDIFIIDEALAVGDTLFQFKCFAHLEQFRARGGTLLLVTHDETAVRSLCDRAIWLDHGRMIADGKADHVCSLYYATSAVAGGAGGIGGAGGDARARARPPRSVRPDGLQPDSALPDGPLPAPLPPQRPAPDSAKPRFDPDRLGARTAPGAIAELQARSEGATDAVLEGGADTTICFTYRGPQEPGLEAGILFRDRMALTIFACFQPLSFTLSEPGPQEVRFRFDLPFVPTGDYVIEALVLKTGGNAPQLIDKSAPCPVSLRTRHISEGLANLRMNAVSLRALPDPAAAR